jgi:hypothetical protein
MAVYAGPIWSNNQSSTPSSYSFSTLSTFNITWTDANLDKILFESNFSGTSYNYSMVNLTDNIHNYNDSLPAGIFYWKSYANDTGNNFNASDTWYFTIDKVKPILTLSNNTASVNTSGLVGYWRFENDANDYSGWDNDGSDSNVVFNSAGGKFGNGAVFDSNTDLIDINVNNPSLNVTNLTVTAWVKINDLPSDTGRSHWIINRKTGVTEPWESLILSIDWEIDFNRVQCTLTNSTGSSIYPADYTENLTTNRWYFLACTYDGTIGKMYIDGRLGSTQGTLGGSLYPSSSVWRIGNDNSGANAYLNGSIDEVQIWNRSLTASEVKELYESRVTYGTQTNFSLSESNQGDSDVYYDFFRNGTVAGLWHFDEGSGSSYAFDSSGNNNTGTLTNMNTTGDNWNHTSGVPSGWTNGKFGSALGFDGSDDYVLIPNQNSFITIPFSFSAWFKLNQLASDHGGAWETIAEPFCNIDPWRSWGVFINNGGGWNNKIRFDVYDSGKTLHDFASDSAVSINTWYHVVVTVESNGGMKMYVNGVLQTEAANTESIWTTSCPTFLVGSVYGSTSFNGTIDEVKIYPRALSAAEVLCHYGNNCSSAGFNNETATVEAGYHYYSARASAGQNYTTASLLLPLNITSGTSVCSVSPSTQSITYGTSITQYCTSNYGSCKLYRNDSDITANNNTPVIYGAGAYAFIGNLSATSNYSSCSDSSTLTVNKAKPVLTLSNSTASVNTSGLVGYWRFEEGTGTTVSDSSGYGNNGTINNLDNGVSWATGRFGRGLRFENITSNLYAKIDNAATLNPTLAITLESWVKLNTEQAPWSAPFITKSGQYALYHDFDAPNRITFYLKNSSGTQFWPSVTGDDKVPINQWLHVVGTYDSSTNLTKIYINGTLMATYDSFTGPLATASDDLYVGDEDLNATIDEVRVWNRSLTADEIKELYESEVTYGTQTNFSLSEQNIGDSDLYYDFFRNSTVAGIWHFDEGSGSTTIDDSGNGNAGTVNGVTWISGNNCKYDDCLSFNNSDTNNVTIPDSPKLSGLNSISIEAWAYPKNITGWHCIASKWGGNYDEWRLCIINSEINWYASDTSWDRVFDVYTGSITSVNTWYHVVAISNGTTAQVYVNGQSQGSDSVISTIPDSTSVVTIGAHGQVAGRSFNGTIDEVKIYPRALSAAEIICQYGNNCSAAGYNNETTIVGSGYHYYSARASGGENYTSCSLLLPLNITSGTSVCSVSPSTQSITYGSSITQYCTSNYGSCKLYRNDSDITANNNTPVTYGAGAYAFIGNLSATSNYSSCSDSSTLTVNKAKPVLTLSNNTTSVNTSDLAGYWRFEETNTSITDYSGYGNNATAVSGAYITSGRFGNAMEFDGSDDYVNISDSNSLDAPNEFTIVAWVKRDTSTTYDIIAAKGPDTTENYQFRFQINEGKLSLMHQKAGGGYSEYISNNVFTTNVWTFVAVTLKTGGNVVFYKDGVTDRTLSQAGTLVTNNNPLFIGKRPDGNNFDGVIDEIQTWNRSLTAGEIKELYESRVTYGTQTNFSCTSDIGQPSLFRNTTNVTSTENNVLITVGVGYHYYLCNISEAQNHTLSSLLFPLNIDKAKPILTLSNNTASVNTSGLIAYWRFENESLGYATDYSGYDNTGTLTNMNNTGNATSGPTTDGRFGSAMRFDNVNDYVDVSGTISINADRTVAMWIKPIKFSGGNKVMLQDGTSNNAQMYDIHDNGANAKLGLDSWSNGWPTSTGTLNWDEWSYVVFAYVNSTKTVTFYINGQSAGSSSSFTNPWFATNLAETHIGGDYYDATGGYFNGTIDEIQIWNRSLTAGEIKELYESRVTYGTQTTFSGNETSSGDADVNYTLWRNNSLIGSGLGNGNISDVQTLNSSYYYYIYNTSGGENYTQSSIMLPLKVDMAIIEITPSQALIDGIMFDYTTPNTNDNSALNNSNGPGGGTAYNITIGPASTVSLDIYQKASNMIAGSTAILIENVTNQANTTNNTGSNLVATGSIPLTSSWSIIGGSTNCNNLGSDTNCWVRYWLDIPSTQVSGGYTTSYYFCGISSGGDPSLCG